MAYNMKNSPINKGTAAKPSPMREFFSAATLIGAGVSAVLGAGTTAISKAQDKKNKKKTELLAIKNEKNTNVKESMGGSFGEGEKLV
jgi:archaellum component FlaG (FlaF/FlaG flagellin family)